MGRWIGMMQVSARAGQVHVHGMEGRKEGTKKGRKEGRKKGRRKEKQRGREKGKRHRDINIAIIMYDKRCCHRHCRTNNINPYSKTKTFSILALVHYHQQAIIL
jgi:hypothetical protein